MWLRNYFVSVAILFCSLGMHALEVAKGCCHLPYFTHTLECMLHEVLEEEAPGKLPKPGELRPL